MLLIFFILGLVVGSFLNVVVYRLNVAENILGRSHCPHCKTKIRWYDNIPVVSFIILRWRCRNCREKISLQYPLVEISSGVLFAFIGSRLFLPEDAATWAPTIYHLGVAGFLMAILVYDFLYLEIPGLVLWPAIGWAVAFNLFFDWGSPEFAGGVLGSATYSGVLAAILAFLFFFLLAAVSKEKWMGIGDAYLAILLGLILGWPKIILGLMLAFSLGALIGLALILLKKKKWESPIPFAPFLIAGSFLAMFFYGQITNWYFSLFY